jgi:drug/metabolite transporter (DMT)-like permease
MKETSTKQAFGLLFVTFFIWGSVYVAGKMVSDQIPPGLLACLRCCVAMFPLLFLARKHLGTHIQREDWKYFILVGILGYFLTIFLIQLGISLTGASMAALLNALTPVTVTLLAALVLKEQITPIKVVCLVLALVGAVIIASGAGAEGELFGVIAVLVSVLSWGFASVFMRRLTAKYPAVLVTTYGMAISLVLHIPVGIWTAVTQPVHVDQKGILVVLYLGLVGSGVAQYTWTKCLSLLPASTCSLFYPLQPVFSAILGALILGETFTTSFFIGLILISIDVALSTWETKKLAKNS